MIYEQFLEGKARRLLTNVFLYFLYKYGNNPNDINSTISALGEQRTKENFPPMSALE